MQTNKSHFTHLRDLIARDELPTALQQLRALLEHSPRLDEVIHQSGRFEAIRQQIRLGVVSHAEASLTQDQIRAGLLELIADIEERVGVISGHADTNAALRAEIEHAISIVNSKNVLANSTINAGGNVHIGDTTTHVSESDTSRRLRVFLYFLVPILVIIGAFLWVRLQKMNASLTLTVAVDNRTPNPELPFKSGTVTLRYGDQTDSKTIEKESIFPDIAAALEGEKIHLHFESPGFVSSDTVFVLSGKRMTLPIRRDNSLARIFGTVKDQYGAPVADAEVMVQDLASRTDAAGNFSIPLPFEKQRREQQIRVLKTGYTETNRTYPIVANEDIGILLPKK